MAKICNWKKYVKHIVCLIDMCVQLSCGFLCFCKDKWHSDVFATVTVSIHVRI